MPRRRCRRWWTTRSGANLQLGLQGIEWVILTDLNGLVADGRGAIAVCGRRSCVVHDTDGNDAACVGISVQGDAKHRSKRHGPALIACQACFSEKGGLSRVPKAPP